MMNAKEVKRIISKNSEDMAFLIGNGINLHFNRNNPSWSDLLLDLWDSYSFDTQSTIPTGISFTEFYDALEIQNYTKKDFSADLQKAVQDKMIKWQASQKQNIVLNRIKNLEAPILTTNFDNLIAESLNLEFFRLTDTKFSDYYPWSCYYSNRQLTYPTEGFGVWYPNGMVRYHRSIKLGLSQYMGNVERARRLIHKEPENIGFEGKNQSYWPGYKTWLHIIFNKSIFIFGLGLNESEVFIRWLLIERAKYYRKFPDMKHKGWFLTKKDNAYHSSEGKNFFLKSVGFEVVEVEDYKTIYEDIWK